MKTNSAICTIYEGHYHYGAAALTNSLYNNGFRGKVWVGYRGELPFWVKEGKQRENYYEYEVADGCLMCFVHLDTDMHLANYKPYFMLDLWEQYCPDAEKLYYFDPDIVLKCEWKFMEEWVDDGIAMCEDVNSPMHSNHPTRMGWRRYLREKGEHLNSSIGLYFNSGFVGLKKSDKSFLSYWKKISQLTAPLLGDLKTHFIASFNGRQKKRPRTALFYGGDQDQFNAATMKFEDRLVVAGRRAMDFEGGGYIMSHAMGGNKPWVSKYLQSAIKGKRIQPSHERYWENVESPIKLYTNSELKKRRLSMKLAKVITRFNHA